MYTFIIILNLVGIASASDELFQNYNINADPKLGNCDNYYNMTNVNLKKQICCINRMRDRYISGETKCCWINTYNPQTHICCNRRIKPLVKGINKCCYYSPYNTNTHMCCSGLIINIIDGYDKCCYKLGYNSNTTKCCHGQLHSMLHGKTECCGTKIYNSTIEKCCDNMLHIKKIGLDMCCGKHPMHKLLNRCCINVLHLYSKYTRCCGTSLYFIYKYKCCNYNQLTNINDKCPRFSRYDTLEKIKYVPNSYDPCKKDITPPVILSRIFNVENGMIHV